MSFRPEHRITGDTGGVNWTAAMMDSKPPNTPPHLSSRADKHRQHLPRPLMMNQMTSSSELREINHDNRYDNLSNRG